jgi:hypothetical protein
VTIPVYLSFSVLAGCILTIAAMILGLNLALIRAGWLAGARMRMLTKTAVALVGWFLVAVALAVLGTYRAAADGLPTIEFGIAMPILIGALAVWRLPGLSRVIDAIPRQWVIGVQIYRVEGVTFLVLYASNLLPGLFAIPAGVGDVLIGLLALRIAITVNRSQRISARTVLLWNFSGILDLIVALTTGFLTSPSVFQRFSLDRPNLLISAFPLVLIPTFLVPLAILLHVVSLTQLWRGSGAPRAAQANACATEG